jgi:DNA-directed RNA polymerase specialized sigma24 family protein
MTKQQILTQENLEALLSWLDPDRDQAGRKYENIRRTLIKIFSWNGSSNPEDDADETINRVARKAPELKHAYTGDPAAYFYGVTKKVIMELRRREAAREVQWEEKPAKQLPGKFDLQEKAAEDSDRKFDCLEKCLQALRPENRQLILEYYQMEKQEKIDFRRELAEKAGIEIGSFRVKIHRIRLTLHKCIELCLREKDE